MKFATNLLSLLYVAAVVWAANGTTAQAGTITYTFTAPAGILQDGPVTVVLTDVAGGVQLDISTDFGANSANFVGSLAFDLDTMSKDFISGITIMRHDTGIQRVTWAESLNKEKAGSNKNLDIKAAFATSNAGDERLDHTETISFLLQETGLTTALFTSAVIHAQGLTGVEESYWERGVVTTPTLTSVEVPAPGALPLCLGALLVFVGLRSSARRVASTGRKS